ncbi:MAG: acyltransferase [Pirellulaceae bacterium]
MLRFSHNSNLVKLVSYVRFWTAKVYFRGRLKTKGPSLIGRNCDVGIRKNGLIEFGGRVFLAGFNQLYSSGRLVFGDRISINEYSRLVAHESITIGDNVTIAKFVTIVDHDHAYKMENGKLCLDGYTTAPIRIGSNVLIGDKVTILKGVEIGDNVVIACNSVVNRNIPANCLVGGSPARILRMLAEDSKTTQENFQSGSHEAQ